MNKEMTYEQAMKRLEDIVSQVEDGQVDIDKLSENLKEAKRLVAFCRAKLTKAEEEVKKILEEE